MFGLTIHSRLFPMILVSIFTSETKKVSMKKNEITILLVDDEPDILEIVGSQLTAEGFRVIPAENGKEALKLARKHLPQLIILDVMMPTMDGIEACQELRKIPELNQTLISFFTARGEDYSHMAGFEAGADDYITKPIRPKVLVSKIKALLRRVQQEIMTTNVTFEGISIDRGRYLVLRDGEPIVLPRKQFELLWLLASRPGHVFHREEILEQIWDNQAVLGGRTIDVHIRKLREKLGGERIHTVKGIGYKFVP